MKRGTVMNTRLGNEMISELIEEVYQGSIDRMIASYENSLLHALEKKDKRQIKLFVYDLVEILEYKESMEVKQ